MIDDYSFIFCQLACLVLESWEWSYSGCKRGISPCKSYQFN